ncbi:hypothetical protein JCM18918_1524 [Cutibacterium acnes JCM 18918]|nr:hypothetical protein JCM18918_1524 [Cutibacterium acnes JCM 18918]
MRAAALMVTALGPPLFNNDAADRMSFFDVGDGFCRHSLNQFCHLAMPQCVMCQVRSP